jgi:hypothetical protein
MSMEFLDGVTLAAEIAAKPLDVENVLWFGIEIADALDASTDAAETVCSGNSLAAHSAAHLQRTTQASR